MNFVADEGVDRQVVARLREDGHSVWYVAEMQPGSSDDTVLELSDREAAVLLTADKDFGELVFRQHRVAFGVILLRLSGLSPARKAEVVALTVSQRGTELVRAFSVITPGSIRVRRQNVGEK